MTCGGRGMDSRIRLHGGRLYAGITEGESFPHPETFA